MLAMWEGGASEEGLPYFKGKRAVSRGMCVNGPQQQSMHSPNEQSNVKANTGAKSATKERVTGDDLVEERRPTQEEA